MVLEMKTTVLDGDRDAMISLISELEYTERDKADAAKSLLGSDYCSCDLNADLYKMAKYHSDRERILNKMLGLFKQAEYQKV